MSHSVVKDFPSEVNKSFVIVCNQKGEISVDPKTLDNLIITGAPVSIIRVDEDDGETVDMTLQTFQQTDSMEELNIEVEDEITRNYNNFRMDHCYTPLTSPSQGKPQIPPENIDSELELDDLAQTLSILEGSDKPQTPVSKTAPIPAKISAQKPVLKDQKPEQNDKVTVLNKVNKIGIHKVYKGVKNVISKTQKVVKKPVQQLEDSDPDDDDYNDSDFELESPAKVKNKRTYKRRTNLTNSKLENSDLTNERNKTVKVRKGVRQIVYKPQKVVEPKPEPPPPTEPPKPPEVKKTPKKEKKIPKPPVDDFALFSTPDIIRRVGSGKDKDSPESPKIPKPAKIEDRSRSDSSRHSIDKLDKIKPHRLSLDSKPQSPDKIKRDRTSSESKSENKSERRLSSTSDKMESIDSVLDQMHAQTAQVSQVSDTLPVLDKINVPNSDSVFDNISETLSELQNEIQSGIIPPVVPNAQIGQIAQIAQINSGLNVPVESQLNLDTGLDMDHGILDNINTDELIPEDILYQVAKLVENPDVQNVIDRTLVDGSLNLEPIAPISEPLTPISSISTPVAANQQPITIIAGSENQPTRNLTNRPIQIVRSDGRVVVLPPIEKPATRSSKKKQEREPEQQQPVQLQNVPKVQPQIPNVSRPQTQPQKVPGSIQPEETAGSEDSDSDDESWNSEDDPDRLWCICKQPHNNRFMICCDTCEDWFHGKCVNITKAMGQQMEQQGKEWMCPNCVKKHTGPPSANVILSNVPVPPTVKNETVSDDTTTKRKSTDSTPPCIVCSAPSRANSVYCSDQCILKHAQGVEKDTKQAVKAPTQRIIVFERATGKCLSGPNAPTAANLKQWLREHPGFEVVRPVNKQSMVQSKLQLVKNPQGKEGVGLALNRKGVQVGVLPHTSKHSNSTPNTIKLIPAAKINVPGLKNQVVKQLNQATPNKPKLVQSTLKSPSSTTTPPKQKIATPAPKSEKTEKRERKQKIQTTLTMEPKQNAAENIRDTVKKTLYEQLTTRLKEVEDIKLSDDQVDKMATEIEEQLYKLFGDPGPKYRAKYRSLMFNIKDTKNQTLWRRICEKDISPNQLVRLSPEEMASQELARWRERENKHQLDMIKKSELEMLTINRTYVLKTHKGEQVMEDRPSVKVDSTEIIPGLGADSTSENDTLIGDKTEDNNDKKSSKHSKKDKDRDRHSSKDRSSSKDRRNNKDHGSSKNRSKRSHSRDRDRHRSDRKRSRSRDRHRRSSHKSSRHKRDKHSTEHLDKKSREILDNLENNKIVPPPEDRLWKHVPQQDIQATPDTDSDHEPSSTVIIPTPPRSIDQEEPPLPLPLPPPQASDKPTEETPPPSAPHPTVVVKSPESETDVQSKLEVEVKAPRSDPRLSRAEPPKVESPPEVVTPVENSPSTSPSPPAKYTSESKETIIWEGNINMVDVAKFFITLHEVSGDCSGLGTELPPTLEIVGRISPDTVWDYIGKMRRSNSKLISVLRLTAANMEETLPYIALYSYLSSRNRLGVIKSSNNAVKDFYILPLASHAPVPQTLLPLSGPGFEESRPPLLLGIIVRAKRKRPSTMDIITGGSSTVKRSRVETSSPTPTPPIPTPAPPPSVAPPPRSYTPPPTRDPRIRLPTIPATPNDEDEPYSPEDSDPEGTTAIVPKKPVTKPVALPTVTTTVAPPTVNPADLSSMLSATLKTSLLDTTTVTSFEPFANKFDAIPGLEGDPVESGVDSLQRKMAELDKCIEKQKEEIRSISQDIVSSGVGASMATNLSSISLPSNLQQILDSIKNIPATSSDSQGSTEEYCPTAPGYKSSTSEELTIPLLLPKISSRTQSLGVKSTPPQQELTPTIPLNLPVAPREVAMDVSLPNLSVPPPTPSGPISTLVPPPAVVLPNLHVPPPSTIPLQLPKLKPKPSPTPADKPTSVLGSLSEEELIRKAAEMLGETEPVREDTSPEPEEERSEQVCQPKAFKSAPVMYTPPPSVVPPAPKRTKIDVSQPPVPGLEDEY